MWKWKFKKKIKVRKSVLAIVSILLAISGMIAILAQTINNPPSPNFLIGEGFQFETQNSALFTAGRAFYLTNYTFINSSPGQENSLQMSRLDSAGKAQKFWLNSTANAAVTILNWFDTFGIDINVTTATATTTMINIQTMGTPLVNNVMTGTGSVLFSSPIVKYTCSSGPCEFRTHWNTIGGTVQLMNPITKNCNKWCRIAPMATTSAIFNETIWSNNGVFINSVVSLAYGPTCTVQCHQFDIKIIQSATSSISPSFSVTDVNNCRCFSFTLGISSFATAPSGVGGYYSIQLKVLIVSVFHAYPDAKGFEQANVQVTGTAGNVLNNIQPNIYEVKFSPQVGRTNGTNATQAGPVLAYPMDTVVSAPNRKWVDISRMLDTTLFHNDATLCSGSTVPTYVLGAIGGAELFNGNQCWQISDTAGTVADNTLHADSLGNLLTTAAWVRIDAVPDSGQGYIISKSSEYGLSMDSVGHFEFSVSGNVPLIGGTSILLGNYYHVAGVWNATHEILFVNGINDTNWVSASSVPVENSNSITVGCGTPTSSCFTGMIDELYVYKRPLGQQEIIALTTQSNINRPTDNYYPSTSACTGSGCVTSLISNNPELPTVSAPGGGNYADENITTYLEASSTWHEVITISPSGNTFSCSAALDYKTLTTNNGGVYWQWGQASSQNNVCDANRFSWDLFKNGVFQSSYGVYVGYVAGNSSGPGSGSGNWCRIGAFTAFACMLFVTFYSQTNTQNILSRTVLGNVSSGIRKAPSVNLGIDLWLFSDQSRIGIRVSNYNSGSGSGPAEFNDWTLLCNGGIVCTTNSLSGQFIEQIITISDINGIARPITYFDPLVRQNTETYAESCNSSGVSTCGAGTQTTVVSQISGHRDQLIQQIACILGGYVLPAAIGALVGTVNIVGGVIAGAASAIVLLPIFCSSIGGIEPGVPGLCITFGTGASCVGNGGGGIGCGVFQGVCTAISTLAGTIASAVTSGVGSAVTTALNGIISILAQAIVSALGAAWSIFSSGLDNVISAFTFGQVTNGFTSFWSAITKVFVQFVKISGTLIKSMLVFVIDTPTIVATLINFLSGSGVDFLNALYIVMGALLTPTGPFATVLSGTVSLFLALFGRGGGPNGTQFTGPGGISYDWGPAGQLTTGLIPLYTILIALWYIKKFILAPWDTTMETFRMINYFGQVFTVVVGFLFNLFMKIVSWLKSLVPTWGSAWA